jgi:ribosomal protein S12 methylthiotransferase accessory factor
LAVLEAELLHTYVDAETGLLGPARSSRLFTLPMVSSPLQLPDAIVTERGYGRTTDFKIARLVSMAEALERMAGMRPRGKRTVVRGSYASLKDSALDPKTVGLYPEERYASEDMPFQRYSDDVAIPWVWAYSFARRGSVLVPETYAYYRTHGPGISHGSPGDRPFVYEISNGCALGSCLEEAVLHGLLEIAERDAFLMTWYARMPIPQLEPASARDPRIPLILERIRHRTGYEVLIFSSTVEFHLPCFWVIGVDASGDPGRPKALCAAGSALDPEDGVVNALQELAAVIDWRVASYQNDTQRALDMVRDPTRVRMMEDHALLYCHQETFHRFDFMLNGAAEKWSFARLRELTNWPRHVDLRGDLEEMIGRFLRENLDVVVVDQTTPEHCAGGFVCVKVIVPGAVPMTFGHYARRVDGLPRLLSVPGRLGYANGPAAVADLNPHPHPFP